MRKLNAALYTLKMPTENAVDEIPVDQSISEEKKQQESEQNNK